MHSIFTEAGSDSDATPPSSMRLNRRRLHILLFSLIFNRYNLHCLIPRALFGIGHEALLSGLVGVVLFRLVRCCMFPRVGARHSPDSVFAQVANITCIEMDNIRKILPKYYNHLHVIQF